MRLRTAAVAAACAALAAIGVAAPANAIPDAFGCPAGFQLKTLSYVLSQASPGSVDAIIAMDHNGDGLLCYKLLPSAIPLYSPTFEYFDNTVPVTR